MDKNTAIDAEIKQSADYINDLEHDLREGDYHENMPALDIEYQKLYQTIQKLMDLTFKATDNDLKGYLATVEIRARRILKEMQGIMVGVN